MGILPSQVVNASTNAGVPVGGGGGFPPIAFFGDMGASPQNAVAGCSYFNTCNGCSPASLTMPGSPSDGDEVGVGPGAPGATSIQMDFGTQQYFRPNCLTVEGPSAPLSMQYPQPAIWRYSGARARWEVVEFSDQNNP